MWFEDYTAYYLIPKYSIMLHNEKDIPVSGMIVLLLVILNVLILKVAFIKNEDWYWALVITLPMLLIAILDVRKRKDAIQIIM